MPHIVAILEQGCRWLNALVWGPATLAILLGTGIFFTVKSGFFQLRKARLWLESTLFAIVRDRSVRHAGDRQTLSQFQTLSTALAGTIGTGSIAGVAAALCTGGPGAIFWMWVSAFFGMMTKYAENVLGNRYRRRDAQGNWLGGPMYYMEYGLHSRLLAVLFSVACALAAFGIGNMAQSNSIANALQDTTGLSPAITGMLLFLLTGIILLGGIQRIAIVAERFVPLMALGYLLGGVFILIRYRQNLAEAVLSILIGAFRPDAAAGGTGGYLLWQCIRIGAARGIFSNEAGLGSSVLVNCSSNVKEPVKQGMWGIFEVFISTMIICTITALVILCTGVLGSGGEGPALALAAFRRGLGTGGSWFLCAAVICFAFSSILGWSCYGEQAVSYLFGKRQAAFYRMLFPVAAGLGCIVRLDMVWLFSDACNGLMALPNLIAILLLSPEVFAETKAFLQRRR